MATPHNGIIIGNTVYNTILSLKLSYLHVLAHFIMWYTMWYMPYFLQGTSGCMYSLYFVNAYFKCTTDGLPRKGFRTNP